MDKSVTIMGFPDGSAGKTKTKKTKNQSANIGDARHMKSLGWEDPLQKEMATCSSVLAWKIPSTEEPGELQSMRSQSQT